MKKYRYHIEYWINTPDGYDDKYVGVDADTDEQAIEKAQQSKCTKRGKDFKIIYRTKL